MYLVGFTSKGQKSGPPVKQVFRLSISRITTFWAQIWNRSDPFYILTHFVGSFFLNMQILEIPFEKCKLFFRLTISCFFYIISAFRMTNSWFFLIRSAFRMTNSWFFHIILAFRMTHSWFFHVIFAFRMTILLFVSNYFIGTCPARPV